MNKNSTHIEFTSKAEVVPSNLCILGQALFVGTTLSVYGTESVIQHIRKHIRPETNTNNPEFNFYMISFDPGGKAWYHITKNDGADIKFIDHSLIQV